MNARLNNVTLRVIQGDITAVTVDAVVITADPNLELSGSLAQAVLQKGGGIIATSLKAIGGVEVGQAVITPGGNLPARFVIHAAGPQMGSGGERGKLGSAVWSALQLGVQNGIRSLAFSAIATGRFGYPIEACAKVMAQKIIDYTFEELGTLAEIWVCLEQSDHAAIFAAAFRSEIDTAQEEASTF